MAEDVQATLDRMVPALSDLQERGVFSKEEIHAIVDRRRLSEYAIRRRQPRKADFLLYLQQEMDLEKLRKIRVTRMHREEKKKRLERSEDKDDEQDQYRKSKHIGDQHIVRHLHIIWKRTIRKFGSDVNMYLQYAAFCKDINAQRALSSVYGEALRLHPHQVDLWIEAASHEFFQAGSIQSARVLMQRGLRIHGTCENLWLQLFALELHFATKMMGRRRIIRGEGNDNVANDGNNDSSKIDDDGHDPLAIATLVFQNAIAKIPDELFFRADFWDKCCAFPLTRQLKRLIWQSIMKDFGDDPDAWVVWALHTHRVKMEQKRAKYGMGQSSSDAEDEPSRKKLKRNNGEADKDNDFDGESVLGVLGKAVAKIKSEGMFFRVVKFVDLYIYDLEEWDDELTEIEIEAAVTFVDDMLDKASEENFYGALLATAHAFHLMHCGRDLDARACLEKYINRRNTDNELRLWVLFAKLSEGDAVSILEKASRRMKMDGKEYFVSLVILMAAKMQSDDEADLFPLFERIVLLAPGFKDVLAGFKDFLDTDLDLFGVSGFVDFCVKFLHFTRERNGIEAGRRVYQAILYKSTIAKAMLDADEDRTLQLFSAAIDVERMAQQDRKRKSDLKRLYDAIVSLLGESPLADDYRQQKREDLANYSDLRMAVIPKLNCKAREYTASLLQEAFEKFRVVHLLNAPTVEQESTLSWKDLRDLFLRLHPNDQESWCVETESGSRKRQISPDAFLAPKHSTHYRAYCSFLVQKDEGVYRETESSLPVAAIPGTKWSYEPSLWMFFGRNPLGGDDLPGRPGHTDSISADGTWHFQLSGSKTWIIRPTDELLHHLSTVLTPSEFRRWSTSSRIKISCRKGDILIINTRLWFHQTRIPSQRTPSISYARDFWRNASTHATGTMSNVDGLYATNDIEEGDVIFTEDTMPDCSLGRSNDPNCDRVEMEDGQLAICAARSIKAGEFFCIADSEDENSSSDDSPKKKKKKQPPAPLTLAESEEDEEEEATPVPLTLAEWEEDEEEEATPAPLTLAESEEEEEATPAPLTLAESEEEEEATPAPLTLAESEEEEADRGWRLWPQSDGKEYVRYPCPFCKKKSVFLAPELYDNFSWEDLKAYTPGWPSALTVGEDGYVYHQDDHQIPSGTKGSRKKLDGSKRQAMREHHDKCKERQPEASAPMAYKLLVPKGEVIPEGEDKKEAKKAAKKARVQQRMKERTKRRLEGRMTEEDKRHFQRKAAQEKARRLKLKEKAKDNSLKLKEKAKNDEE